MKLISALLTILLFSPASIANLTPIGGGGGSGTVTSVAATVPAYMSVTGSPVTTSGTLALDFSSQTANKCFASPSGGSGAPSFRALVASDMPSLSYSNGLAFGTYTDAYWATPGLGVNLSQGSVDHLMVSTRDHALNSTDLGTDLSLTTGRKDGASSTDVTGSIYMTTGDNAGSGNSGNTNIASGNATGTTNGSGNIDITSGAVSSASQSGRIQLLTGQSSLGNSGSITSSSGAANTTGFTSGDNNVQTGAGYNTGAIFIQTGDGSNDSGAIQLITGTASGTRGGVTINGGQLELSSSINSLIIPTQMYVSGGSAASVSACGTSPSVDGYDGAGTITIGTGGVATSCTLTFATTWTSSSNPNCFVNYQGAISIVRAVATQTSVVFTSAAPFVASSKLDYFCIAH